MSKKIFTILIIGIFILYGCGQSENDKVSSDILLAEEAPAEESDTNYKENELNDNESSENLLKPLEIPINTKAEDFYYYQEDYVELIGGSSLCQSDGENIYLLSNPDLYIMPVGTDELSPADIEIPEGMDIYHFTVDNYGRMHLLIAERNKEEYFIWQLDENFQVDKTIEISSFIETIQMPRWPQWFLVLDDGTYYIQWSLEQDGIIVSSEGILKHQFTLDSLGIGQVRQAAVGKDGHIYIVHGSRNEKREIGRLDIDNCLVKSENPALYFPADEIFIEMSDGTDTNLLLLSMYSGIWACDTESGIMENRVSLADIRSGLDKESEFWINTFLPDGRLLLLGQAADDTDNTTDESHNHLLFKYIPAGK